MAQGGILNTLKLAITAQKNNIETIITSAIETGYGLSIINQCCAALNNQQHHGLSTSSWLEDCLTPVAEIKQGKLTLKISID